MSEQAKADAYLHIDGLGDKRLTFSGRLGARTARMFLRANCGPAIPLYSLTNPLIVGLVEALEWIVGGEARYNQYDQLCDKQGYPLPINIDQVEDAKRALAAYEAACKGEK
jgi:hypothetical protein